MKVYTSTHPHFENFISFARCFTIILSCSSKQARLFDSYLVRIRMFYIDNPMINKIIGLFIKVSYGMTHYNIMWCQMHSSFVPCSSFNLRHLVILNIQKVNSDYKACDRELHVNCTKYLSLSLSLSRQTNSYKRSFIVTLRSIFNTHSSWFSRTRLKYIIKHSDIASNALYEFYTLHFNASERLLSNRKTDRLNRAT